MPQEVGPICGHVLTNAELARDARIAEAEYRRLAVDFESEGSTAARFFAGQHDCLGLQWPC